MADWQMKFIPGSLKLNSAGIIAVTKSSGVGGLCKRAADTDASRCNAMAPVNHIGKPKYGAETKQLSKLVAGVVYVANPAAGLDNKRHNTLKKGCNV